MLSWIKDKVKGIKTEEQCIFCNILKNHKQNKANQKQQFLYEDQKYFAIHDIKKASAQQHILVLTKKHIRSALDIKDKQTILQLKEIAQNVLDRLSKQKKIKQKLKEENKEKNKQEKYRFGFHLPPYNSVDHIHLHGFQLPFQNWKSNSFTYGWMMTTVQQMLKMIKQ